MSRLFHQLWFLGGRIGFWLMWPLIYGVIGHSHRTRAFIRCADEVLLVRPWLSSGVWQLPGGWIKRSESATDAVLREIREETGIILSASELHVLGNSDIVREVGIPYHAQLFDVRLDEKPAVKKARIEIADYMWVPLSQLETRDVSPSTKRARAQIELPS